MEFVAAVLPAHVQRDASIHRPCDDIRLIGRDQRFRSLPSTGGEDQQRLSGCQSRKVHGEGRQRVFCFEGDKAPAIAKGPGHLIDTGRQLRVGHCFGCQAYCGPVSKRCQSRGKGYSGHIGLNTHPEKLEGMANLTQMDLRGGPEHDVGVM